MSTSGNWPSQGAADFVKILNDLAQRLPFQSAGDHASGIGVRGVSKNDPFLICGDVWRECVVSDRHTFYRLKCTLADPPEARTNR